MAASHRAFAASARSADAAIFTCAFDDDISAQAQCLLRDFWSPRQPCQTFLLNFTVSRDAAYTPGIYDESERYFDAITITRTGDDRDESRPCTVN